MITEKAKANWSQSVFEPASKSVTKQDDSYEVESNYSDDMGVVRAVSKIQQAAPRGSVAYRNIVGRDSVYFDPFTVEDKNLNTAPHGNQQDQFEFLEE